MPAIGPIVVATRNPGKLAEIRHALRALEIGVCSLEDRPDLPEPAEDGETFAENAATKARYYAQATGLWALADDSGLVVDALGGAPGVRSARFAGVEDDDRAVIDEANNARLLHALSEVPDPQRTARFVCCLTLADSRNILLTARGTVEGRILRQGRGRNGFGYDPLFLPAGSDCTVAELGRDEKNRISHRGQAVREFVLKLQEMLDVSSGR